MMIHLTHFDFKQLQLRNGTSRSTFTNYMYIFGGFFISSSVIFGIIWVWLIYSLVNIQFETKSQCNEDSNVNETEGGGQGGVHINHKKALNNSKASYIAKIKVIYSSL